MSDDVEIEIEITTTTPDAILVECLTGEDVWIPRSMISDYSGTVQHPDSIFLPQWYAEKKDLV